MQSFPDLVSFQSFGNPSNSVNYLNSSFNQNNNLVDNSSQILRQTLPDSETANTLPLIASNLPQSQWLLNPFCSPQLISATVSANKSLTSPEMASLFASNFLITSNANHLSLSLDNSLDATLASVSGAFNTNSNKEVLQFKTCIVYPPKANVPKSTTRERPLGCRTVFVGGLPENITEGVIEEIFERVCGKISAIRISKKNFCHIRFESEKSVDTAIGLSGHRIKINDLDDSANTGRLHIDYAQARDDQYEWECKQRALQREMRHRERLEYDRLRPPSPPIVHFSEHEATQMIDKLKCDQSFMNAVQVLINWLERGECQKRNSGQFYAMIQSTNNQIKRLQNERTAFENEWVSARQLYHSRMQSILVEFTQIEKVFEAAMRQKAWDHFTKAQRKHIDSWFKQIKELMSAQVEDVLNKREEDEMDLSDGENNDNQISSFTKESTDGNLSNSSNPESSDLCLRDENDSLKCQIESFRNEAAFAQAESRQEKEVLERQILILQQALQGMQHQLLALNQQNKTQPSNTDQTSVSDDQSSDGKNCDSVNPSKRALLISLISIYFNVHPYGTTSDEISAYLRHQSHIRDTHLLSISFIDSFLSEFPQLFTQLESDSNGRKLWRFSGFQS